jgi:hypothetical protein
LEHIAPHDLRRTCAKLCHSNGGEIEQIQFLLGHASIQTTERYLGCKQNLGHPVNDLFDLRIDGQPHEDRSDVDAAKHPVALEIAHQKIECRSEECKLERASASNGGQRWQIAELDTGT